MSTTRLNATVTSGQWEQGALLVRRVEVREQISRLFEIDVLAVGDGENTPALEDIAGADVTLSFCTDSGEVLSRFHGIVAQPKALDDGATQQPLLSLKIVPLVWMATLVETLDIFLEQSVPQLIEGKLSLLDLSAGRDFELRLGDYSKREFAVQYKETDLNFISRLAEHEGICFFFEHDAAESRLVFSDHSGGHQPINGGGNASYNRRGKRSGIFRLERELNLIPSMYVCRDYNYRIPTVELMSEHHLEEGFGGGVVEYGSHLKSPEQAKRIAQIRAQERLAQRDIFVGESTCPHFHPGATVKVDDYARMSEPLLLTEVVHQFEQLTHSGDGSVEQGYRNRFRAVPATRPFRPARTTPKPQIAGLVSGIIETRQGEVEPRAKLDSDGRYRVRFLFDTAPSGERQASKRVRQIQPSAGPGYGMHFPLKPGTEVALAFVDGDPDRPLIVGAIPNPITPSPVTSAQPTASRIRSETGILVEFEDGIRS